MVALPIDQIHVGERLRHAAAERVAELADSISVLGLQQPISVRTFPVETEGRAECHDEFWLIAGLHRLEACRKLGHQTIEANILSLNETQVQLWEIDENLCRAELNELERGEHLAKRKEIYEWAFPKTKRGGNRGNQHTGGKECQNDNLSFSQDTATKTGIDQRTIQRSIRRVAKIAPQVRDRIRALPAIADSGVELDALSHLSTDLQAKAVSYVEHGSPSVRHARKLLESSTPGLLEEVDHGDITIERASIVAQLHPHEQNRIVKLKGRALTREIEGFSLAHKWRGKRKVTVPWSPPKAAAILIKRGPRIWSKSSSRSSLKR